MISTIKAAKKRKHKEKENRFRGLLACYDALLYFIYVTVANLAGAL